MKKNILCLLVGMLAIAFTACENKTLGDTIGEQQTNSLATDILGRWVRVDGGDNAMLFWEEDKLVYQIYEFTKNKLITMSPTPTSSTIINNVKMKLTIAGISQETKLDGEYTYAEILELIEGLKQVEVDYEVEFVGRVSKKQKWQFVDNDDTYQYLWTLKKDELTTSPYLFEDAIVSKIDAYSIIIDNDRESIYLKRIE